MASSPSTSAAAAMLSIPEKKPSSIDLYRTLRQHIASSFSEPDAIATETDLADVRQMRSDLEKPPPDHSLSSLNSRLDLLLRYHRALSVLKIRSLIPSSLSFTWSDAFKTNKRATQKSVELERAAVVFNVAATHSQIGVMVDRASEEGRKQACNEFQKAAGAFALLKQMVTEGKIEGTTVDLTVECVGMLEKLMLAQAQECFFEKVIADSKPPSLCSKVAKQVGLYYEEAYTALNSSLLHQNFDRAWISHIQLKSAQFYGEACNLHSMELHQNEQIGDEIARLKIGTSALTDARKFANKGVSHSLLESVSRLESTMNRNLERAVKENNRVYLMRVPLASSLPALPAADLVKPTPMAESLDFSGETLFCHLIPDSIRKSLSKYNDMVNDVIKTQSEKIRKVTEITRVKLNEVGLPDSIALVEGGRPTLPTDLKAEAIQVQAGPAELQGELLQIRDLRRVTRELMTQIEEMLAKEAGEDSQFRARFGERWTRPESSALTNNLKERLVKYRGNLTEAELSDARVERIVMDNYVLMGILDCRPIESALPSLVKPVSSGDDLLQTLKQCLNQLENLGLQLASLEDKLKETRAKDDIVPKLLAYSGSQEALFEKEIGKYDKICEEIGQKIQAHEQLLLQIQALNDKIADAFHLKEYKGACERIYEQIRAAIAKIQEIKGNISEGIKFYVTLQDALNNLKQQTSDFVFTRNMQSQEMTENLKNQPQSQPSNNVWLKIFGHNR